MSTSNSYRALGPAPGGAATYLTIKYINGNCRIPVNALSYSSIFDRSSPNQLTVLSDVGKRTAATLTSNDYNSFVSIGTSRNHTLAVVWKDTPIHVQEIVPGIMLQIRVRKVTILACYFPPSYPHSEVVQCLKPYTKVTHPVILVGDLNARFGRLTGDSSWNPRGRLLMESLNDWTFHIRETTTNTSTGSSCVDHVISNQAASSTLRIDTAVSTPPFPTDHYLVQARLSAFDNRQQTPNLSKLRWLIEHSKTRCKSIFCGDCHRLRTHDALISRAVAHISPYSDFLDADSLALAVNFALTISAMLTVGCSRRKTATGVPQRPTTATAVSRLLNPKVDPLFDADSPSTIHRFFPNRIHPFTSPTSRTAYVGECFVMDDRQLTNTLSKLKLRKASGHDGVRAEFLVISKATTAKLLGVLYRKVLSTGVAPASWKVSKIIPVFKGKGSREDSMNYRPISLVSVLRKTFESHVYRYLERKLDISDCQGGFRRGRGTIGNIALAHTFLASHPTNTTVLLDIKSAFDRVNRSLLLAKLEQKLNNPWLTDVLTDMWTNTYGFLEGSQQLHRIYDGCPQGAPLSPLLFSFFLDHCLQFLPPHRFAAGHTDDDSLLLFYADDILLSTPPALTQRFLDGLQEYGDAFGVIFAPAKSVVLGRTTSAPLQIADSTIPEVSDSKYLGIWMDNNGIVSAKLTQPAIIEALTRKLSALIRISTLTIEERSRIFKTFVSPLFEYCGQIFGLVKLNTTRIQITFKKAVREILLLKGSIDSTLLQAFTNIPRPSARRAVLAAAYAYRTANVDTESRYTMELARISTTLLDDEQTRFLNSIYSTTRNFASTHTSLKKITSAELERELKKRFAPNLLNSIIELRKNSRLSTLWRTTKDAHHLNDVLTGRLTLQKLESLQSLLDQL